MGEKLETDEELLPSYIPIVKSSSENKVYELSLIHLLTRKTNALSSQSLKMNENCASARD